jgi:transketolase
MAEAKATREAFGEALARVGEDERVVALDGDLLKSTYTSLFRDRYPDRFVECGIAESNMVGVASGLALSGKIPFAASFACFIAGRLETIRMSVGYQEAPVRLVGTHAGVGIGEDGASQMGLEDIAAMRALPNMTVIQPADAVETERAVEFLIEHDGPAYLRLTRQKVDMVNQVDYQFELGTAVMLREGSDVALLGTGGTVQECLAAAEELAGEGVEARVLNVHTLKPIDRGAVLEAARACGALVTVEDHFVTGGLGSAVAEVLAGEGAAPRLRVLGVETYGQSGQPAELYDHYGISAKHIATAARSVGPTS